MYIHVVLRISRTIQHIRTNLLALLIHTFCYIYTVAISLKEISSKKAGVIYMLGGGEGEGSQVVNGSWVSNLC